MADAGMANQAGIVRPSKNEQTPALGPLALMVSSRGDLSACLEHMGLEASAFRRLFTSRLYQGADQRGGRFAIAGPYIGAPYAVMILETLIAWGARKIIIFGWCGAVSPKVKIGDIVVPSAALIDEGTSGHYRESQESAAMPSPELSAEIKKGLQQQRIGFHEGVIWSTDAVFRETPQKVARYQREGVMAVEMELSALFTVAGYHGVDAAGILVVSDELSSLSWKPGFTHRKFKNCRNTVGKAIGRLLQSS